MEEKKAIVLFDGICRLCNGLIGFLLKKDHKNIFEYIPIQSKTGQQLLAKRNITNADSVVFIKDNFAYYNSDAVIQIVKLLPFPWNWIQILKIIPKKWRDFAYTVIARNRFKWFGKTDSCKTTLN